MNKIAHVADAMIAYYAGDRKRINHFMKVHGYASTIGRLENLPEDTQLILEIAALTHDIGIKNSESKYGSSSGEHQQIEGPPEACKLLHALLVEEHIIDRVCWLIAHHHTYENINTLDYQILVEADFLVNIDEDGLKDTAIQRIKGHIFKTSTGIAFLQRLYHGDTSSEL